MAALVQAIMLGEWLLAVAGLAIAGMALANTGCGIGGCSTPAAYRKPVQQKMEDIQYEEVVNKQ
jgi:hypothetical protein